MSGSIKRFIFPIAPLAALFLFLFANVSDAQPIDGRTFWLNCAKPAESKSFEDCMMIIDAVALFAFMEGSGEQLCKENGVSLEQIARRIGELGADGRLSEFGDIEAEYLVFAALREAYKC